MSIYDTLNSEQKRAVLQTEGPVLILAGAGSGKTRVLTHRTAYLIDECGVNPWNIMAITFTNKAAGEMRERVDKIVGFGSESIWVSTFHSSCVRILRRYADRIGYGNNFTIYDSDDSKALLKDICKRFELETRDLKLRQIQSKISTCKDNLVSPEEYSLAAGNDYIKSRISKAYIEYQAALKKNNAMDFDDLIMNTVMLFRKDEEVLESYRERFRYIMVDEYQDTNTAQFELIALLAGKYRNLCVVGDDDQSIYRFRGANIRNILDFEKNYPDATVIKLEQNYRSTQTILDAANNVIRNNRGRKEKALWTDEGEGEKIHFMEFDQAPEEADYIANDIFTKKREGKLSYNETAVLYRTNAQSRLLEERMVMYGIPYNLVGGTNFYARREIKDLLAYLKTIDNGRDDLAVRRIINVPKRGIGAASINKIQDYADSNGIGFFDALSLAGEFLGGKAAEKLHEFDLMIMAFRTKMKTMSIEELLTEIIDTTGYDEYLRALDAEEEDGSGDNDRRANVSELMGKVISYEKQAEDPSLSGFLEEVALVADVDSVNEDDERVVLMTLHSAKGLEFEDVYIAGMEDGTFPGFMTIGSAESDPMAMEEERRLAYVGITRAKKHLTLSCAHRRMVRGSFESLDVSRFVEEIPEELIDGTFSGKASFLFEDGDTVDDDDDFFYDYDEDRPVIGEGRTSRDSRPRAGAVSSGLSSSSYDNRVRRDSYGRPGAYKTNANERSSEKIDHVPGSSIYGPAGTGRPKARTGRSAISSRKAPDLPYIARASASHKTASKSMSSLSKGMPQASKPDYIIGDRVKHVKYGVGTVLNIEDGARDYKVTVDFDEVGQKIMFAAFAKLQKI
ncbi:ATP-dependent helicase [Butyrivibrio sp. MC2013]|uniref:ATP-dependent helicase n=1 Tax=Butyrivibrio sp. MC2013 TaxID=1280686 RepID=UPI0004162977|nr:UvrD-helicase domain-containing protein [Butyrivibrio sp. MC2013]